MEENSKRSVPTFVYVIVALAAVCGIMSLIVALDVEPLIKMAIESLPPDTEEYQMIVDYLNASQGFLIAIFVLFGALFIFSAVGTYIGWSFMWIFNMIFWIIALIGGISFLFGIIFAGIVIYALFRPEVKEYFGV